MSVDVSDSMSETKYQSWVYYPCQVASLQLIPQYSIDIGVLMDSGLVTRSFQSLDSGKVFTECRPATCGIYVLYHLLHYRGTDCLCPV